MSDTMFGSGREWLGKMVGGVFGKREGGDVGKDKKSKETHNLQELQQELGGLKKELEEIDLNLGDAESQMSSEIVRLNIFLRNYVDSGAYGSGAKKGAISREMMKNGGKISFPITEDVDRELEKIKLKMRNDMNSPEFSLKEEIISFQNDYFRLGVGRLAKRKIIIEDKIRVLTKQIESLEGTSVNQSPN